MKTSNKIPLTELAMRLGKRMNYPIGMNHLAVLIHGWRKKRPKEAPAHGTLRERKRKDGYPWLTPREVEDLSAYAGYDLTQT